MLKKTFHKWDIRHLGKGTLNFIACIMNECLLSHHCPRGIVLPGALENLLIQVQGWGSLGYPKQVYGRAGWLSDPLILRVEGSRLDWQWFIRVPSFGKLWAFTFPSESLRLPKTQLSFASILFFLDPQMTSEQKWLHFSGTLSFRLWSSNSSVSYYLFDVLKKQLLLLS